jgi:hypothetical protein
MPRVTQRLTEWVDAHPRGGAVVVGLVAGLLAFLLGLLIFRRPAWNLFVIAALAAGGATYFNALFREQDRERSQRRPRPPASHRLALPCSLRRTSSGRMV